MAKKSLLVIFVLVCAGFQTQPLTANGQTEKGTAASNDFTIQRSDVNDALAGMDEALKSSSMDMTPEDEYYLGRAVAAEIIGAYGIYTREPALTEYLNKICLAVIVNSPRPTLYAGYHVELLDTEEICAFATPGGHIFVGRGLAASAPSEDALAGVIAHETAHIQLRHVAAILGQDRVIRELSGAAGRAASIAARNLNPEERAVLFRESVNKTADTLFINGYSAAQEFDADKTAGKLLNDAGYDPGGLLEMLKVIEVQPRTGNMSATHPSPPARITNLGAGNVGAGSGTRSSRIPRFESALPKRP